MDDYAKILNAVSFSLEQVMEVSRTPLSRPLEVGFRHSSLSPKEMVERYGESFAEITQHIEYAMKELPQLLAKARSAGYEEAMDHAAQDAAGDCI